MQNRLIGGVLSALCGALALWAPAFAQIPIAAAYTDFDLGDREAGKAYTVSIGAENRNCPQPLDFRFTSITPWLRLPADPVVRQVPAGQTRQISANLDLTDAAPGRRQAFVDVDCENCGFLIFKNCKINKQQLRLNVNVVAAAPPPGGQPAPGGQQQGQPDGVVDTTLQIDYDDKRIPKPLRDRAKAADGAWRDTLKKKEPCEEQLEKLRAAADDAKAAAETAAKGAKAAENAAAKAKAEEAAAKKEYEDASKAWNDAQDALAKAQKAHDAEYADRNSSTQGRQEAREALAAAKAAEEAAKKRVDDAVARQAAARAQNAKALEKDAAKARAAADKAAEAATAADAAVKKKEEECRKLQEEADKAKAEKDAADAAALAAIPPPPAAPTARDIQDQDRKLSDCQKKLADLAEAQRKAIIAMARLGALGDNYESDLKQWVEALAGASGWLDKFPPGTPFVDSVKSFLDGVINTIKVWSGVDAARHALLAPVAGVVRSEAETMKWLQDTGQAGGPDEAKEILKQMTSYSATNSSKGMQTEFKDKQTACKAEEDKLDKMQEGAKAK